jgi:hypothetical protein
LASGGAYGLPSKPATVRPISLTDVVSTSLASMAMSPARPLAIAA